MAPRTVAWTRTPVPWVPAPRSRESGRRRERQPQFQPRLARNPARPCSRICDGLPRTTPSPLHQALRRSGLPLSCVSPARLLRPRWARRSKPCATRGRGVNRNSPDPDVLERDGRPSPDGRMRRFGVSTQHGRVTGISAHPKKIETTASSNPTSARSVTSPSMTRDLPLQSCSLQIFTEPEAAIDEVTPGRATFSQPSRTVPAKPRCR